MDEEFAPVDLVSPTGRPWTARTPAELINLTAKGYRRADEPKAEMTVEDRVAAGDEHIRETYGTTAPDVLDYDKGGSLAPGTTTAVNLTEQPETVLPPDWPDGTQSPA